MADEPTVVWTEELTAEVCWTLLGRETVSQRPLDPDRAVVGDRSGDQQAAGCGRRRLRPYMPAD